MNSESKYKNEIDRAMLVDKIIIEYSNRKDVDYLGMLKLTDKLCKFIKSYIKSIKDFELKLNKTIYKKLETIEKKVKKLTRNVKGEKYVDVAITQNREGKFMLKYSVNEKIIDEESKLDGKYIIATNNYTLTNEEIFYTYKQRNAYEKAQSRRHYGSLCCSST